MIPKNIIPILDSFRRRVAANPAALGLILSLYVAEAVPDDEEVRAEMLAEITDAELLRLLVFCLSYENEPEALEA